MPKFYFYYLFVIAFLLYPHGTFAESSVKEQPCGLECWLANLTINIPTQSTIEYGFNLTIRDGQCRGIQIGGINSSFIPPVSLTVNPFNVSIMCQATWSYYEIDWPHLADSGTVYATVNQSSLLFGLSLIPGPNGLAESANTTLCHTNITITNVTFTGGFHTILNYFSSYVASTIQSELDDITCTQLTNLVNTNLTESLQQLDELIVQHLIPQPPSPGPPLPDSGIELTTPTAHIQVSSTSLPTLESLFSNTFSTVYSPLPASSASTL
jgi:hypothetical protein